MAFKNYKVQIAGLVVGIVAISILSLMLLPATKVTAVDQKTIEDTIGIVQPGPSPDVVPIILEDWKFHPYDINGPSTGQAQLMASEIYVKPDQYNTINYNEATWLQNAIDKQRQYIDLSDQSKADYFDYRNTVKNDMAYFEVTFPDGTTKYYHIDFHEDSLR